MVPRDQVVLLDVRDNQVNLATPEILVPRVLPASAAHLAGRETLDLLASLVSVATMVPLVQMVHRVLPVFQGQPLQPTASSSPDTVRARMCHSALMEQA